jgi:GAF domain-containing protein/ligand-binding sensor domain-containing protein
MSLQVATIEVLIKRFLIGSWVRMSLAVFLLTLLAPAKVLMLPDCFAMGFPAGSVGGQVPDDETGPASPIQGFGQPLEFEHISLDEGLSSTTVTQIVQDSLGFLWIGTDRGLNKYDGYHITTYLPDPKDEFGLVHGEITALLEDRSGVLWVGTVAGLHRLDRLTGHFTYYPLPNSGEDHTGNPVLALYEDNADSLWIGAGDGLYRFDREQEDFVSYRRDQKNPYGLNDAPVHAIYMDASGVLWVGARRGLYRWPPEEQRFRYHRPNLDTIHWQHNVVRTITQDQEGMLWIGTAGGGFLRFDPSTLEFKQYLVSPEDPGGRIFNSIAAVSADKAGYLWIGTDGGGLYQFDPINERFYGLQTDPDSHESLSSNYVRTIYEGQSGVLWIGTEGGGVNKYDRNRRKFLHYQHDPEDPNSLSHNRVTDLYEDGQGFLWIGTDGGGLDSLDLETGQWHHYQQDPSDPHSISSNYITHIMEDAEGHLWIGTWGGGVNRLDRDTGRFEAFRHDPLDPSTISSDVAWPLLQDAKGSLWFTSLGGGLERLVQGGDVAPHEARFQLFPAAFAGPNRLTDSHVTDMLALPDGTFWIATLRGGLLHFDPATTSFTQYRAHADQSSSLQSDQVNGLLVDGAGRLWVATAAGLYRYQLESDGFLRYTTAHGLPDNQVQGIQEDDHGLLWISTQRGLAWFNPEAEMTKTYGARDGLQGYEFTQASAKGREGRLYFGGINGFNVIYPDHVPQNTLVPAVVLTSLEQNGSDLSSDRALESLEEITLRWPNNDLEFEFAALSFSQPERNEYAYLLDGFDSEWNYIGNRRFGRYTNLPGGTYTLRLRASNSDGLWNDVGDTLTVTVVPPFWQRPGLQLLAVLALVGVAFAVFRVRMRRMDEQRRELQTEVAARTREIEQRRQELEALYRADQELYRHLQLHEVLQSLVDIAVDFLHADKSALLGYDGQGEYLIMRMARGFSALAQSQMRFPRDHVFVGPVVYDGEPVICEDVLHDSRCPSHQTEGLNLILTEGVRSFMHLPIKLNNEVFGLFNVSFEDSHAFGLDERRLFEALAQRAAQAIENARLFDAEQRRAEQFRVIGEVGHHITSILDVDRLLEEIVQVIRSAFGYYVVGIALVEGDELVVKSSVGVPWQAEDIPVLRVGVGGEGVMGWVAATGQPLLVPDVSQEPRYLAWPAGTKTRSELAVPLKIKSQVIGVLNVESDELDVFDESDLMLLQALANQAAVAIENARLFEAEQRRAEQFRVISDVGSQITSIMAVDEMLLQMAQLIQESFDYYHVGFGLIETDEVVYRVGAGALCDDSGFAFKPARLKVGSEGLSGWVASTGQPLMVPDVHGDPRYLLMRGAQTRSELVVPIMVKGNVIGVLDAQSDRLNAFDEMDLRVLQALAHQAGAAIENTQLYEQAQQAAILEERGRLARDLHDAVTQTLFSASLLAEVLPATWKTSQEEGEQLLRELRQLSRGALAEMRALLLELRPAALMDADPGELLRQLADAVTGRTGIPVEVKVDGRCDISGDVHVALYRIAQESLNNIIKHSRAGKAHVIMRCTTIAGNGSADRPVQQIELRIVDDGIGFDPLGVTPDHLGLGIIRERAEAIDASLSINSAPGAGTQIIVLWRST